MKIGSPALAIKVSHSFSHRQYLLLAIPLIISGISTPILGAVDTAVVGRLPDPSAIGGVAIGAFIFNTMYWLFGFLRVSTTGFTSQAQGSHNENETVLTFLRPMFIAVMVGLIFILLQKPILHSAIYFIGASNEITAFSSTYFSIRIWGAPFTLLSYVMIGWLMGLGKVKWTLATQIFMNLLNIVLDILFVPILGLGVAGVAYATLISEVSAVLFGAWIIVRTNKLTLANFPFGKLLDPAPLIKMLKVNRDLFLRTVCLLTMTGIFTAKGASMGEVTLAANAVLLQIHYLMAYLLGGFANASSIIVGRAIGGKDQSLFKRALSLSAQWGFLAAIVLSLCLVFFGEQVVSLFTTIHEVKVTAYDLLIWMLIFPFVGFWGLQLEGIFSGATEARFIRDSILFALLIFLLSNWLFIPHLHNNGVWLSFIIFSAGRSFFLWLYVPKLTRVKFG
ncbi:MATE family efflux transporter [Bacillus sp. 31A1R]|uniref:Probable multidrug resistance protein NorM n=1 Tax=Robertmurraya mangrovi TaxID=3098077 RepID=A0ABU5J1N1_9BACI|nr:MATE family efflux transporter [Bacillus sp. 31A1R]MDZ5473338.1 MATE family efflux transporter [Bacillus sp. 31A1R]